VARVKSANVAASDQWVDPDGVRMPAGEVHAWEPGTNQTLCGLALSRSQLRRFSHVTWADVQPGTGRDADEVQRVCPRCAAATGRRRDERPWQRTDPRP
jgi:hypothetical protein